jgi:hypothetical protein
MVEESFWSYQMKRAWIQRSNGCRNEHSFDFGTYYFWCREWRGWQLAPRWTRQINLRIVYQTHLPSLYAATGNCQLKKERKKYSIFRINNQTCITRL